MTNRTKVAGCWLAPSSKGDRARRSRRRSVDLGRRCKDANTTTTDAKGAGSGKVGLEGVVHAGPQTHGLSVLHRTTHLPTIVGFRELLFDTRTGSEQL